MADDTLAERLAAIHGHIAEREKILAHAVLASVPVQEFNAAQDRLAEVAPALVAALETAIAHIRSGDDSAADGIEAIARVLTGEESR